MGIKSTVTEFDKLPDSSLVSITTASVVSGRGRSSIYRHFKAGELTKVRVGQSTRIRVSELRKLIGLDK
jgi:hypothetical protein